jgi:hypothetical protein
MGQVPGDGGQYAVGYLRVRQPARAARLDLEAQHHLPQPAVRKTLGDRRGFGEPVRMGRIRCGAPQHLEQAPRVAGLADPLGQPPAAPILSVWNQAMARSIGPAASSAAMNAESS